MTVKDLVSQAEEPYRSQMLNNSEISFSSREEDKLSDCVLFLFVWDESKEGYDYWDIYCNSLIKKGL